NPFLPRYYDPKGRPVTSEEWSAMYEHGNRIVARDVMANGYVVSTVWLGLDHGAGWGDPQIFETMVFRRYPKRWRLPDVRRPHLLDRRRMNWIEVECRRYSSMEESIAGHREIATAFRGKPPLNTRDHRKREVKRRRKDIQSWVNMQVWREKTRLQKATGGGDANAM